MKTTINKIVKESITAENMKSGQIGVIVPPGEVGCAGDIVMRCFDHLISLSTSGRCWSSSAAFNVELLPPGSTVTIEVTE